MTNEDRLELFADLIEPAAEAIGDREVARLLQSGKPGKAVKTAIKNHKSAVIEILARLEGVEPKDYIVPGPIGLTTKLVNLFNDPELQQLFQSQAPSESAASSGPVMESTEGGAN